MDLTNWNNLNDMLKKFYKKYMLYINIVILHVVGFTLYFYQVKNEKNKLENNNTIYGLFIGYKGGYGGTGCYVTINPTKKKEIKGWIRNCRYCNALPGDSVLVKFAIEDSTVLDFVRDDKGRLIIKRKSW